MDKKDFIELDFSQRPRIPQRVFWVVGAMIAHWLLWQIIPSILFIWVLIPIVGFLAWMASFGWKEALRTLRFWLDQVIGENF